MEHLLRAGRMFDHGPFRSQIALQNRNGPLRSDCLVKRPDDIRPCNPVRFSHGREGFGVSAAKFTHPLLTFFIESGLFQFLQILSQRPARHCHRIQVKIIANLLLNGRNTACIIKDLRRPPSGRTHVEQIMSAPMQPVKGIARDGDAKFMCYRRDMQQRVCRAGNGRMHQNRIFKTILRHQRRRSHPVISRHADSAYAGAVCIIQEIRTCRRKQRTARQ